MSKTSIEITVPSSAKEGDTVEVSVKITCISEYGYRFKTTVSKVPDLYPSEVLSSNIDAISSGSFKTYTASFIMPNCNTTILVWVEQEVGVVWYYDNSSSEVVTLEEAAIPGFSEFGVASFSKA